MADATAEAARAYGSTVVTYRRYSTCSRSRPSGATACKSAFDNVAKIVLNFPSGT